MPAPAMFAPSELLQIVPPWLARVALLILNAGLWLCGGHPSCSPAAEKLEPGAKISLEFPELPATFFAEKTGSKQPAHLSAQLPDNYSPDRSFPLFVYLGGGDGGAGDAVVFARGIIGPRDFIVVNLPLFKDHTAQKAAGLPGFPIDVSNIITTNDTALLSQSYRVMLQKLSGTVPNIAPEGSALGGFSNGAHAASCLVAARDEFILHHFRSFYFLEGGLGLILNPDAFADPAFKQNRILMLFGDHKNDRASEAPRALFMSVIDTLEQRSKSISFDFTRITMTGYGHAQPPEYLKVVGHWVRQERFDLPSGDPRPSAAAP